MSPLSKPALSPPAPALKILSGSHKGKQFRLLSRQIILGKHASCDVVFKDNPKCSIRHGKIKKEGSSYIIESLDPQNPVLVNKKPISAKKLEPKDTVTIGDIQLLFLESPPPSPLTKAPQSEKPKKQWLTPPRFLLIIALFAGAVLLTSKEKPAKEKKALSLKTESDILEELESIKTLNKEESEKKVLNSLQKSAQSAFIKGFRDYGKGYFYRALKLFQHCLTLNKNHALCQSYVNKSKIQIDRLIQKQILLGKAYKKNKQYAACQAAFKNVELMVKDTKSMVYKEAKANRKSCETQLKNKI